MENGKRSYIQKNSVSEIGCKFAQYFLTSESYLNYVKVIKEYNNSYPLFEGEYYFELNGQLQNCFFENKQG